MRLLSFLVASLVVISAGGPVGRQLVDETARRAALEEYRAGQELLLAEQYEKAVERFNAAIKIDPLLTLAHYGLGQAYMGLKEYRSAIRAYSGCREAFRSLHNLAATNKIAVERRREDEIRELEDNLMGMQSGRVKGLNPVTVSRMQDRVRELEKTKNEGLTGVGEFRTPSEVSLALGSAYFRAGDLSEAETAYLAAISVSPRMGEAHNNLAVIYMINGRLDEAEKEVRLAEQAGFKVNPMLKEDLRKRRSGS